MSRAYANQQPIGYHNHVRNITIVGATGKCGSYITKALLDSNKFNLTAITRPESKSTIPAGITVKQADYSDHDTLVEILKGQDVLLITMYSQAPASASQGLIQAAVDAKVPWILPNEWGMDLRDEQLARESIIGAPLLENRKLIEKIGGDTTSYIAFVNGPWYEYSLSFSPDTFGFNVKDKKANFYDDGKTKITTTTWPQVGRGAAGLLSLPILPQDEHDQQPTLSDYRNSSCYVASFLATQEDMFESILRVTGAKREEWTITYEDVRERYKKALEAFDGGKGNRMEVLKALYSRMFWPDGSPNYEERRGLDNDKLGVPKEDLDTYTKIAIKMMEEK